MGKLDTSMGFAVNEDGSITRTNNTVHINQTPDFIPVSMSGFNGGVNKIIYILCYIVIIVLHTAIIGYDCYYIVEHFVKGYRMSYDENFFFESSNVLAVIILAFDCFLLPRVIRSYPSKNKILKCADYVQANLKFNYGYPYIMTNNHIGVLNAHKKKVIIPPDYDVIYWVIPQNVLCAVKNDKQTFYDVNGKILTNVPSSYYAQRPTN